MNKLVKTAYLTAVLLAFGMWSGQAAADDVLATGDDVTDAAFANAVETDALEDERAMSAEAGDGGLAMALDIDSDTVIFADADSTTNQKAKQKFEVGDVDGDFTSTTGKQTGNTFSDNRFSIGLFNTGNNVQMGASMNVNVIFTQ